MEKLPKPVSSAALAAYSSGLRFSTTALKDHECPNGSLIVALRLP
jgi:hypothetical protein